MGHTSRYKFLAFIFVNVVAEIIFISEKIALVH